MIYRRRRSELFIGIPTWNSELFIETTLRAIKGTTSGLNLTIAVVDNSSCDRTVEIARSFDCDIHIKSQSLPDALNFLVTRSQAPYSLFMHADTVLLSSDWFQICSSKIDSQCILVSPQDIGCGPYTRPWGVGKPESSFMLFRTDALRKLQSWRRVRRFRLPYPQKVVDFYTRNVTHNLPNIIADKGFTWRMMKVLTSPVSDEPVWKPAFKPISWTNELSYFRYGLGNFYCLDGHITHYHNWFDRIVQENVPVDSEAANMSQGGIPAAYISLCTRNFINDYAKNQVQLPDPATPEREPKVI